MHEPLKRKDITATKLSVLTACEMRTNSLFLRAQEQLKLELGCCLMYETCTN
jgi:hypothetical protein